MNELFELSTLRLIDANANRAREGIRTAEDHLRFVLHAQQQAAVLKGVRAEITRLIEQHFDARRLLAARSVANDPLNPEQFAAVNPTAPESPSQTAQRGLKRAQEAIRVLEEYLRAAFPQTAGTLAQLRYGLYETEQWLIGPGCHMNILHSAHLYILITGRLCKLPILKTAESVLKAGAKLLQLREKGLSDKAHLSEAQDLRQLSNEHNAVLIGNDRVDLALLSCSEGIHLGQDDLTPQQARQIGGQNLLIGRSTHSVEQARAAVETERADYIAIGSIYDTATKPERTLAGLKLAEQTAQLNLGAPVFAIGGITAARVAEVRKTGIKRVAVSAAIISSADPGGETRRFLDALAG